MLQKVDFVSVLETAIVYFQKTILPESLDIIICTFKQESYKAYCFNNEIKDFEFEQDIIMSKFKV